MALTLVINDGTQYQAADITTAFESLVANAGVADLSGGDFSVSQNGTPDKSVDVAAGFALVPNSAYSNGSGNVRYWPFRSSATENVTIPDNASGNPRVDRICLKVDTGATAGVRGTGSASVVVVTGTAAASPTASATPNDHLSLATVAVANGFTSIVDANITDDRVQIRFPNYNYDEPTLLNTKKILEEDSAGVTASMAYIDSSDYLHIGDSSLEGVLVHNNVYADVYRSSAQSVTSGQTIIFNTEIVDLGNDFNTTTGIFTAPVTGRYSMVGQIGYSSPTSGKRYGFQFDVNGTQINGTLTYAAAANELRVAGSAKWIVTAGEPIKMIASHDHGSALNTSSGRSSVFMQIELIGA